MSENAKTIDTLLDERRTFAPSAEFKAKARVTDQSLHDAAEADPEAFWAEQANKYVSWYRPFDKVLEWDLPFAKWFLGGELNVSYNCLDRHV
jgi:acetyl-CoA synthetase